MEIFNNVVPEVSLYSFSLYVCFILESADHLPLKGYIIQANFTYHLYINLSSDVHFRR